MSDEGGMEIGQPLFLQKSLLPGREIKVFQPREAVMRSWLVGVEGIRNVLNTPAELNNTEVLLKKGKHIVIPSTIKDILENETTDEEGKQLLSVGLFILREKPEWKDQHGKLTGTRQELFGGTLNLESLPLQPTVNCVEASWWVKVLADQYGIQGKVARINTILTPHSFFKTESGKIVDVMEGWRRGGLFQSEEQYAKYLVEKKKAERKRHNSFSTSK